VIDRTAEVEGAEDVAGSEAKLVDSAKGADVMGMESDGEGQTTVGRIDRDGEGDSKESMVSGNDRTTEAGRLV
jgi:hypothetical protein